MPGSSSGVGVGAAASAERRSALQRETLSDLPENVRSGASLRSFERTTHGELAGESFAEGMKDDSGSAACPAEAPSELYREEEEFWETRSEVLRQVSGGDEGADVVDCDPSFLDELSLIVQAIQRQKGKMAEEKVREQSAQLQFLDNVVRRGKAAMAEKAAELRRAKAHAERKPLLYKVPPDALLGGGVASPSSSPSSSPASHFEGVGDVRRDFEDILRWIELRHAKEINEMREVLSSSLKIDLGGSSGDNGGGPFSQYPDSAGVYELMQQMAGDDPFASVLGGGDEGDGTKRLGSYYHSAYRKVLLSIQKAHSSEKAVLHATVAKTRARHDALAAALQAREASLGESRVEAEALREQVETLESEREREKAQMIEAMRKLDVIRESEREASLEKDREHQEELQVRAPTHVCYSPCHLFHFR